MLTSDNKENPCDLPAHSIPTISEDKLKRMLVDINRIRSSAAEYGGGVVFKFAQSKGAFYKQIAMHSATQYGVCKALCDHWMACHANGLSLFDGLYMDGQKGQFNIDMLVSIKQLHIDALTAAVVAMDFSQLLCVSNEWLTRHGLKLRRVPPETKDARDDVGRVFMDCITGRGRYQSIVMAGGGGLKHVVATYTAKNGEIRFFDPNYGDFIFLTHGTFKRWFEEQFWPRSHYQYNEITAITCKRRH
ncbi:YopT-type cysteine protease domain-containing protein [Pseudomonas putida]|uniref:YopT-type cysteine protease domain-containing protein n=1 Tax=Pseudomonas putida TaxID=303 RepID=UPI002363F0AB|nr:YopT-type cysteine protease domain-containing protein [Pseudomonas putida]MDD2055446.1 YopT-type cysteine protease domain-containing protein [Pseudomonas putida]